MTELKWFENEAYLGVKYHFKWINYNSLFDILKFIFYFS